MESLGQVVGMECSVDVQHKVSIGRERKRDRASKCTTGTSVYPLCLKWSQSPVKVSVDGLKAMTLIRPTKEYSYKKNKACMWCSRKSKILKCAHTLGAFCV